MADDPLFNATDGALPPDHPLLARAQEALKKQLLENKKRVEDEFRAKQNELKVREGRSVLRSVLDERGSQLHADGKGEAGDHRC